IDTQHATEIPVPTPHEIVATTPRIPYLEIRIPADVVLQTTAGPLRSLTITRIPHDRAPIPTPMGATLVFTPQAHGALVLRPAGRSHPRPAGQQQLRLSDLPHRRRDELYLRRVGPCRWGPRALRPDLGQHEVRLHHGAYDHADALLQVAPSVEHDRRRRARRLGHHVHGRDGLRVYRHRRLARADADRHSRSPGQPAHDHAGPDHSADSAHRLTERTMGRVHP